MINKPDLTFLKKEWNTSENRKKAARKAMSKQEKRLDKLHDSFNQAREVQQYIHKERESEWIKYTNMCINNDSRIDELSSASEHSQYRSKMAFKKASLANSDGDHITAAHYKVKGRRNRAKPHLFDVIRKEFEQETRSAYINYRTSKSVSRQIQEDSELKKVESLKREYSEAKQVLIRMKKSHSQCEVECKEAKEAYLAECERIIKKAGIPTQFQENARVKRGRNNETHIYFGGIDGPFGENHGHYIFDKEGVMIYRREYGERHGPHNYLNPEDQPWRLVLRHEHVNNFC